MYPCHVSPHDMRQHPIGTGPFRFVEYKPNQDIKIERNPDYWKPGRPYLDGVEYTIIPNRSTALLAFVAGKFDLTFPNEITVPLLSDVKSAAPQARFARSRQTRRNGGHAGQSERCLHSIIQTFAAAMVALNLRIARRSRISWRMAPAIWAVRCSLGPRESGDCLSRCWRRRLGFSLATSRRTAQ